MLRRGLAIGVGALLIGCGGGEPAPPDARPPDAAAADASAIDATIDASAGDAGAADASAGDAPAGDAPAADASAPDVMTAIDAGPPVDAPPTSGVWGTPALVEAFFADGIDVVVDANGVVTGAWTRLTSPGPRRLWSNRFVPDAGWGTATQLSGGGDWNGNSVSLAVDASGAVTALWEESVTGMSSFPNLWSNRSTPGPGWGTPQLVAVGHDPQVAVAPSGDAIAAWTRRDGTHFDVVASRYTAGAWSAPVELQPPGETGTSPRLAVDAGGNALVIWSRGAGPSGVAAAGLASRRFTPAGGWAPMSIVADHRARDLSMVGDAEGRAVGLWSSDGDPGDSIWSARFAAGAWSAPVRLDDPATPAYLWRAEPALALDGDGRALAIWNAQVPGSPVRYHLVARRHDGVAWSAPAVLAMRANWSYQGLQLAADDAGNAVALWLDPWEYEQFRLRASRFTPAGGWTAPVALSREGVEAHQPRVVLAPSGRGLALWTESGPMQPSGLWSATLE